MAAAGAAADFSVLTGTDSMLVSYLLAGARGTICANANVVPELVLAVYEAVRAGKLDEALRLEARSGGAGRVRHRRVARGVQGGGRAAGVGEPWLVPPRLPLTDAETAQLVERLTALGIR